MDRTVGAADQRFAEAGGDTSLVPRGAYCYRPRGVVGGAEGGAPRMRVDVCPYWGRDASRDEQESGYCALLGEGDWMSPGLGLLWDQVKECSIGEDADDGGGPCLPVQAAAPNVIPPRVNSSLPRY